MSKHTYFYDIISSPINNLLLVANSQGLKNIVFADINGNFDIPDYWLKDTHKLKEVTAQLQAYFAKELHQFNLPLAPEGTIFQQQIWNEVQKIPYGTTQAYSDIANAIGNTKAVRAIGMANATNPIPIIIPCHRVIGKNGKLVGYAGGLEKKISLLQLEGVMEEKITQFKLF